MDALEFLEVLRKGGYAEWAGDVERAEELYKEPAIGIAAGQTAFSSVEDYFLNVVRLRRDRRVRSRRDFLTNKDAVEPVPYARDLRDLRYVVHQITDRRYLAFGYPLSKISTERVVSRSRKKLVLEQLGKDQGAAIVHRRIGSMYIEGVVDEFALIQLEGLWVEDDPPRDSAPIFSAFQSVMESFDSGKLRG